MVYFCAYKTLYHPHKKEMSSNLFIIKVNFDCSKKRKYNYIIVNKNLKFPLIDNFCLKNYTVSWNTLFIKGYYRVF